MRNRLIIFLLLSCFALASLPTSTTLYIVVSGITDPEAANGIYCRIMYNADVAIYEHLFGLYQVWVIFGDQDWQIWDTSTQYFVVTDDDDPDNIPTTGWTEDNGTGTVAIAVFTPTVEISTPDELQFIGYSYTTLGYDYVQINDIDMDVVPYNAGVGFKPIGDITTKFELCRIVWLH